MTYLPTCLWSRRPRSQQCQTTEWCKTRFSLHNKHLLYLMATISVYLSWITSCGRFSRTLYPISSSHSSGYFALRHFYLFHTFKMYARYLAAMIVSVWQWISENMSNLQVFCLGFFCRAQRPAPFSWRPDLLKKPKCPALLTKKIKKKSYQSHMAFSSVLPFLLPTHSVDCAVHLLLSHSRALLVSSALFHPFTTLIMPFFFSSPR